MCSDGESSSGKCAAAGAGAWSVRGGFAIGPDLWCGNEC
jgi:hypothetical protein